MVETLQGQVLELTADNEALRSDNQALSGELERLRGEKGRLEGEIGNMRDRLAKADQQVEDLRARMNKYGFEVRRDGAEIVVTLPQKVLFKSGSATILPQARKGLQAVSEALRQEFPGDLIRVEGHTDNAPIVRSGWADNWQLSGARSRSVLLFLLAQGVQAERVYFAGFAFHRPVADNATKAGQAKNRRVEVVIIPSKTQ
jgi:flagellar motor protein MotB